MKRAVTKDTQVVLSLLDALALVSSTEPAPGLNANSQLLGVAHETPTQGARGIRDVAAERQLLEALDREDFDLFAALAQLWSSGD